MNFDFYREFSFWNISLDHYFDNTIYIYEWDADSIDWLHDKSSLYFQGMAMHSGMEFHDQNQFTILPSKHALKIFLTFRIDCEIYSFKYKKLFNENSNISRSTKEISYKEFQCS